MSNFAANPFALLEDESAEPIVPVAKPAEKQISQKKIPLKEQKQQKVGKLILRMVPFEERMSFD
jgi:hypothetical protein